MTEYYGLYAYKQQTCIAPSYGGWESKIKVPEDLVSGEGLLLSGQMAALT